MSMTKMPPVAGTRAISPMLVEKVERSSWAYWWCVLIGVWGCCNCCWGWGCGWRYGLGGR